MPVETPVNGDLDPKSIRNHIKRVIADHQARRLREWAKTNIERLQIKDHALAALISVHPHNFKKWLDGKSDGKSSDLKAENLLMLELVFEELFRSRSTGGQPLEPLTKYRVSTDAMRIQAYKETLPWIWKRLVEEDDPDDLSPPELSDVHVMALEECMTMKEWQDALFIRGTDRRERLWELSIRIGAEIAAKLGDASAVPRHYTEFERLTLDWWDAWEELTMAMETKPPHGSAAEVAPSARVAGPEGGVGNEAYKRRAEPGRN